MSKPRVIHTKGFTLIELLVVLMLISISLAIIFLNPKALEVNQEADKNFALKLNALFKMAQAEAVLNQQVIRFRIDGQTYGFQRLSDLNNKQTAWVWYDKSTTLKPQNILSSEYFFLQSQDNSNGVLFYPSSEITPFVLDIKANNNPIGKLVGTRGGKIELELFNKN